MQPKILSSAIALILQNCNTKSVFSRYATVCALTNVGAYAGDYDKLPAHTQQHIVHSSEWALASINEFINHSIEFEEWMVMDRAETFRYYAKCGRKYRPIQNCK